MATITLKGNQINTVGELPAIGTTAPDFSLTNAELSDVTLNDFKGTRLVLNVFPSIDTPVCAASVRNFHQKLSGKDNVKVLCISRDLPFATSRFCGAEGLEDVVTLSEFRKQSFGKDYNLEISDGPLAGLFSRAVIVIGEDGKILYTEQVPEIAQEPNYDAVLELLS